MIVFLSAFNLFGSVLVRKPVPLSKPTSCVIAFAILACSFLVFIAIYLQNSPVGSGTAIGVQGRYFIPLFLLLVIALPHRQSKLIQVYHK